MIERRPGQMLTLDTRGESHEQVDKETRYKQIIEVMESNNLAMSAKEIAHLMYIKGYIPTSERNFTAPRLTELCQAGKVEPVGKIKCIFTDRMVTAYRLRDENE